MSNNKSSKYILWIAWRHLVSKKHKVGLSFMTLISIVGVAVGVAALVIVLSVMGGFERDLKEKMFRGLPHLELMAENAIAGFSLKEYPLKKFKEVYSDAQIIEPYVQADVVLKRNQSLQPVTIFGIDPDLGGKLWGFSSGIIQGSMDALNKKHTPTYNNKVPPPKYPGIILGEDIAYQLSAEVGDEVKVLSPQAGMAGGLGEEQLTRIFVVAGIFRTDLAHFDSRYVVMSMPDARKYMADYERSLDEEEYVSGVAINLTDPEEVDDYAARTSQFANLKTLTWKTVNKSLLFALMLEKFTMGAILNLIVLVAAFSISGTIMMTVFHKRGQVALLKSIGMTKRDVSRLFMIHGAVIGIIGIAVGLSIGIGVCWILDFTQAVDLPEGIYYQAKLPVEFLPLEYVIIAGCAWVLSTLAAVYPAFVAAKQDPSIGLRYV